MRLSIGAILSSNLNAAGIIRVNPQQLPTHYKQIHPVCSPGLIHEETMNAFGIFNRPWAYEQNSESPLSTPGFDRQLVWKPDADHFA
jgi:hypothetical protein